MDHSFDIDVAVQYGWAEAILIRNFQYWISKNRANGNNNHDGHWWTYNTLSAFGELFPYLSEKKIRTALDNLIKNGVIIKGTYNEMPMDRTAWYAFVDEDAWLPKGQIHLPYRANPFVQNGTAIPNSIPDNIPNNNTTTTCAKDVFFHWVKTSDLTMHYIPATFMRFGIPIDTDIDPYLHVFFDGSIADREMTERGERLFVLQHFERWLPKYIESKQKENDNARNQSAQRGCKEPIQERPPVYPT